MVYVHLATGFEEVEATTILDILRRGGVDAQFVSIGGKTVKGVHDIEITADLVFEEADYNNCEMIVLPGGGLGTTNLQKHEGLCNEILSFAGKEKKIAAMCAAPMIFGGLGLLKNKKATIYPGMEEYIEDAKKSTDPVVCDGNIITSQAPGTAMLFALELVKAVKGAKVADDVRKELYMAI